MGVMISAHEAWPSQYSPAGYGMTEVHEGTYAGQRGGCEWGEPVAGAATRERQNLRECIVAIVAETACVIYDTDYVRAR